MGGFLFYLFAAVAAGGAVVTVTRRNPLAGALSLAVTMIGLAGLFLLLQGYLVFVLQILVYAGAVVVLIIFVIMLLDLREPTAKLRRSWKRAIPGALLGLALLALLGGMLRGMPRWPASAPEGFGTVESVGEALFHRFAFPFEVLSVVLLVAIVGAVLLAKKGGD